MFNHDFLCVTETWNPLDELVTISAVRFSSTAGLAGNS